jgi:hypothetical protein
MKTTKKPTMAFIAQPMPGSRLRIEQQLTETKPRVSYVWRPGNKRMIREKSA